MKTTIWIYLLIFISTPTFAQKRLVLEKGDVFFSSEAQLELIKATTKSVKGIIDLSTYQFAIKIPIKSFVGFNSDLQRVHFNENYMESDKYPDATFAGKIIEQIDFLSDGTYEIRAKGDLDIHGVKQNRILKVKVAIKNGVIAIGTSFKVPLSDHNISIPKIVSEKIATEINVVFTGTMKPQ
ncbi:MAG: YceI family protein [Cytophagales bacterium]|nr:YceI family protein [Cytophagales bacterium]